MTCRLPGQKALICDWCETVYDDRPRNRFADVVARAKQDGWVQVYPPTLGGTGTHFCPDCCLSMLDLPTTANKDT